MNPHESTVAFSSSFPKDEESATDGSATNHDSEILPPVKIAASPFNARNRSLPGGMTKKQYGLIALVTLSTVGVALGVIYGLGLHEPKVREPLDDDYAHLDTTGTELPTLTRQGLPVNLESYSFAMMNGYDQCSDLKNDLEEAVYYLANVHIDNNARNNFSGGYYNYFIPRGGRGRPMMTMDAEGPMTVESAGAGDNSKQSSTPVTESSYGTNNQEEGVEEGDVVTSNGEHVFSAYGNRIVVWDADSGEEVSRTTLPTTDVNGVPLCDDNETTESKCYTNYEWQSLSIVSLLLHKTDAGEERLVVVASSPYILNQHTKGTILGGYHGTRIYLYNVSDPTTELQLLSQEDTFGYFQAARSIGANAHVISSTYVNDWNHLASHLSFWDTRYEGMDEEEYRNEAYKVALEFAPLFATTLFDELMGESLAIDCSHIAKIVLMVKERARDLEVQEAPEVVEDNVDDVATDMEEDAIMPPLPSFNKKGVLNSYVQVTSFQMDEDSPNTRLKTSNSGMFMPLASYLAKNIYASAEKLVIAGEGYEEDEDGDWVESTLLFTYDLDGASSTPASIGVVPGSLLNQFSLDHYVGDDGEDYLRVATTTWAKWGYLGENEGWGQKEESTNQVMILSMQSKDEGEQASTMKIVGEITGLGVDERIYACRFVGDKGYLVTFRQTDPFYTLDLSDVTDPKMVGELKILGLSNYIHPIDDDNILAIGQDADENGRTIGLQIALFDVSDFADPKQIQKYVETDGFSSAEYDHKAFRYLPESELLILPVYSSSEGDYFDGFIVYDVDTTNKFSKLFEISHVSKDSLDSCWDMAYLGERSMVFDGKVTTMKGHTVLSHDLSTQEREWKLNLDKNVKKSNTDDCGYWRPMFFGF